MTYLIPITFILAYPWLRRISFEKGAFHTENFYMLFYDTWNIGPTVHTYTVHKPTHYKWKNIRLYNTLNCYSKQNYLGPRP